MAIFVPYKGLAKRFKNRKKKLIRLGFKTKKSRMIQYNLFNTSTYITVDLVTSTHIRLKGQEIIVCYDKIRKWVKLTKHG